MSNEFSVTGAVTAASNAHGRLERAIANGTTWRVLVNGCPYVTCASLEAAKAFIGKSKKYQIVKG